MISKRNPKKRYTEVSVAGRGRLDNQGIWGQRRAAIHSPVVRVKSEFSFRDVVGRDGIRGRRPCISIDGHLWKVAVILEDHHDEVFLGTLDHRPLTRNLMIRGLAIIRRQ